MIRNACKAVGSISDTSFDIRFNPDIFSPGTCAQSWDQPFRGGCVQPAADTHCAVARTVGGFCLAGQGAGLCVKHADAEERKQQWIAVLELPSAGGEHLPPPGEGCAAGNPPEILQHPSHENA